MSDTVISACKNDLAYLSSRAPVGTRDRSQPRHAHYERAAYDRYNLSAVQDRDFCADVQRIRKGGDMVVMAYRTHDHIADFGFSLEYQPEIGWRVYVVFYHHRINDRARRFPYQSVDRNGRHYVDWDGRIGSLGEARIVAELWAEIVKDYQRAEVRTKSNEAATRKTPTTKPRPDAA
ncbi:MAG TPA: hypothetical protein VJS67_08990 [Pseudonocardiaceae bacterium]|nr:hypothetical protein [Pseudonocardiaceae bacterium]